MRLFMWDSKIFNSNKHTSFRYIVKENSVEIIQLWSCEDLTLNLLIPNVIESYPVTSIGKAAFHMDTLRSVTIPKSVINIDNGAFMKNNLTNITIPESVIRLGNYASWHLTSLTVPGSVKSIGVRAFSNNG